MKRALGVLCFWLAIWLLAGCSHAFRRTSTAHRTEETRTTWQTAETAESQTHSVATEKKQGSRQTRRWAPDGKLLEEVIEHWGSDGRVQVSESDSASRSASGADFASVVADSSTTATGQTKAGWPSPFWLLLPLPLAALGWWLRRHWPPRIPGWL